MQAWSGSSGAGLFACARLLVCASILVVASAGGSSHAAEASVEASEQDGYGRIVFTFTDTPVAEAVVSNGVLVVSFTKPVDGAMGVVEQRLPRFVSAARRDPDGMAVRFALTRPVQINMMAAGEKLFVDVMPSSWKGMPPPLPSDVMADLTKRALEAQQARQELARSQSLPPVAMKLSAGSNEQNIRLTFSFTQPVDVRFAHEGRAGVLTVPASTRFDAASARASLPPQITQFDAKATDEALFIRFTAPEGMEMRGRQEEEGFVVDVAAPEHLAQSAVVPSHPEPAPAPVAPAATATPEPKVAPKNEGTPAIVTETVVIPRTPGEAVDGKVITAPKRSLIVESQPIEDVPVPEAGAVADAAELAASGFRQTAVNDLATSAQAKKSVDVQASDALLQIAFPFDAAPPAAAFVRGTQLFVVFDGNAGLDVSDIEARSGALIGSVRKTVGENGLVLEFGLTRPKLASLTQAGQTWVLTLGDAIAEPVRPLDFRTTFTADGRTAIEVRMENAGRVHEIVDSRVGDRILAVTTRTPANGVLRARDLIDLTLVPTAQGLALKPFADDVSLAFDNDVLTLSRPRGLTLTIDSTTGPAGEVVELRPDSPFAADAWRKAKMATRETFNDLERVVASSKVGERTRARVQLARFYLANGDAAEAKGALDVAESDSSSLREDPDVKLLRAVSLVMLRRFDEAAELLDSREFTEIGEASLWRMMAEAGLGNVALAREAFREGESVLPAMPADLQHMFRQTMAEVAIGAGDFATAATQMDALDKLGDEEKGEARRDVMRGRIAEGFGQTAQALESYRQAMESKDEIAKAEARLYATNLRYRTDEIGREDAVRELEQLTTYWRGDDVEALALARLSSLYKEEGRWRDAFGAMKTAVMYHPDEASTRFVQEEMSGEFARLFLSEGPDAAPPTLESVALFYDFKELTPPGKKGDELIRKLADRLVQVDLLTQAADLLTYQVRNRLSGAARAQVAAHAAAIELMDRKPDRALDLLHETRLAGLPEDLVRSRLILEARALSDLKRPDLALEMIAAYSGEEIDRLRADIQWSARRWQPAGEGLELVLGDRWKRSDPLDAIGRQDVLRTAIAYALAGDVLGLDRMRQKFAPKMAGTPDQITFDTVTAPSGSGTVDFGRIAAAASVADTFRSFLESYRKRYPDTTPPVTGETNAGAPAPSRS